MADWIELFEKEGTVRTVTGNSPLRLDDPELVWLVISGKVDVFAVPVERGRKTFPHIHVLRAEAGQGLFGMRSAVLSPDIELLAKGFPDTSVLGVRRSRLMEGSTTPALARQLGVLLEDWVQGLTSAVVRGGVPKKATLLEPGQEAVLEDGAASPIRGTLWVRLREGHLRFLGTHDLPCDAGEGLFPLCDPAWLSASGKVRLYPMNTEGLNIDQTLWSGLETFHQTILDCVALNVQTSTTTERECLHKRAQADRRLIQASLIRLASVDGRDSADGYAEGVESDALLLACRLVGTVLGIDIRPPVSCGSGGRRSDRLSEIARASRFRLRRVLLTGDWWRRDNGPLLAFRADERPIALLMTSTRRYQIADPVEQTRTAVTATVAASLHCIAYTFYRPFPTGVLRAWDLVRFGLRGCKKAVLEVILLAFAGGLLGLLPPVAAGVLFNQVVPGADRHQLLLITLALVVSAFSAGMFQLTRGIAILRVEGKMDSAVEAGIWDRLLSLPVPFFRRYTAGDLTVRAMGVAAIRYIVTGVVVSSLLSSVFSFLGLGLLFCYDVRLAGIAALLMLGILSVLWLAVRLQVRHQRIAYHVRGRIAGMILQVVTGIGRLRVAAAEDRVLSLWARDFSAQKRAAFKARCIGSRFAVFGSTVPLVASMTVFAAVGLLPEQGLTVGTFVAFNAAYAQVLTAALALGTTLFSAIRVIPLYERLKPILEALPEINVDTTDPGELAGGIEISHVSFRYQPEGPLILDDLSLRIAPGTFVAFVGPSGSGKSTVLRLLLGFEAPTSGSVYYDSQDLAGLNLQALRRQIGVVLQNGKVISGSILTNIVGSSLFTLEDAWEAARLSGLDDDIKQLPMGMHTVITEGGSTFSVGQRQRLMIARAIVSRPRIVLFDEATSALDNKTQAIVSKSLESLKATRVVVAHRLSTIRNADWIFVMEAGRIVQQGRYEDLHRREGLFADLVKRQLV